MKHQLFFLLLFIPILLSNCSKDLDEGEVTFVFGHFYGECIGEGCVEIFKIADNKLFEDSKDMYPGQGSFYNGDFQEIDQSKLELVKDIIDDFPMSIFDENETVIGQPDAGDWGGLYIEFQDESNHDFWLLDQMKSNVPNTYHDFIDKVNEKIAIINE